MLLAILIRKLKEQIGASRLKLPEAFPALICSKKNCTKKLKCLRKKSIGRSKANQ